MLILKKISLIFCFFISANTFSQDILGKWKTIDDQTNEAKSIVEIYEENGKVFGKIIDILNPDRRGILCEKCKGEEKNKPVLGLVIIKNMESDGKDYENGTICSPESGKFFKCRLRLMDDPNALQVRGYIGVLYSTQYWQRVVE